MPTPDTPTTYEIERSGLLHPQLSIRGPVGPDGAVGLVGKLTMTRRRGLIVAGEWSPVVGERLWMRRDPGLLRSQFSLWTEGREWLGSSLRSHFVKREVMLHTGSRPLRLLPLPGLRCGWILMAPKTGDLARIELSLLGARARVVSLRKMDMEHLVFALFVASQLRLESLLPGPEEATSRSATRLAG